MHTPDTLKRTLSPYGFSTLLPHTASYSLMSCILSFWLFFIPQNSGWFLLSSRIGIKSTSSSWFSSAVLADLSIFLMIRISAHQQPVSCVVAATAEWLTSEQHPQFVCCLVSFWDYPSCVSRAHGWSSHPLSLQYSSTIDPLLVTQGFNISVTVMVC